MGKFIIQDDFWAVLPEARIGVVVCMDVNNRIHNPAHYADILCAAQRETFKYLTHDEFSSNPVIKVWREAFQLFKTKKGARSSIEALLKRVQNGNPINSINPLVDLYNSISLRYALPCGGEDMDCFSGDLILTKAEGNEEFVALGTDENAPPYPGEIIYKDSAGAVCRCWNWREATRTMLTEETTNAFLCIELVNSERLQDLQNALADLAASVQQNLGGTCRTAILDRREKEMVIR